MFTFSLLRGDEFLKYSRLSRGLEATQSKIAEKKNDFKYETVSYKFHFPGTDLVEWQLRVAAGEQLPLSQDQIIRNGHAVECRIYAEEPRAGFLPRAGTLHRLTQPTPEEFVRVSDI